MSEYINISDIPFRDLAEGHNTDIQVLVAFASDIANLPTIEVVWCKECKFKRLYAGETKYYYCALEDRPNRNWSVDDWDFCSWGERIEE